MARPRSAAVLLVLVAVVALTGTACSDPDIIDGRGRILGAASSGVVTPSPAAPVSGSPGSSAPGPTAVPTSGASTSLVSPGLALLRQLRAVSTAGWQDVKDTRTGTTFALPAVEPARTRLQNGISQRSYEHKLSKQSTISVSYVHTATPAAARALLGVYPTQLQNSIRALGADDAEVTERRAAAVDGQPSLSFRFSFTPTTIPQIPPTWLVTAVAAGADIVLAQTIVFPPTTGYDYLRLARIVHQRLVQSLRLAG